MSNSRQNFPISFRKIAILIFRYGPARKNGPRLFYSVNMADHPLKLRKFDVSHFLGT